MEAAESHVPRRARAYALAFASALCAGAGAVVGKIGVGGASTATYLAWLFAFSALYSAVWLALAPRREPRRFTRHGCVLLAGHAALAVVGTGGWYAGLVTLGPGLASFSGRAEVLVTIALGAWLLGERLRRLEVLGGALALSGLALMCLPEGGAHGFRMGFLWVFLGSLGFGSSEVLAKVALKEVDANTFVLARSLLLAAAWIGIALVTGEATVPAAYVVFAAAGAALLGPVAARALYMHALRTLGVSQAALVAQAQPLCAALVAYLVLGDALTPLEWAGGLVLLGGTVLVVRGARAPSSPVARPRG
jgi:drug/metabolite transporter (DMT)-like permease